MRYSGAYAVLLALHLLGVAFLVGPSAYAAMTGGRAAREGDAGALRAAARTTRVGAVGSVVVVGLGMAMLGLGDVGSQWSMGDPWVSASFALWLVAAGLSLGVVVPALERAAGDAESGGGTQQHAGRLAAVGGVVTLLYAVIVVLMVYKPGA